MDIYTINNPEELENILKDNGHTEFELEYSEGAISVWDRNKNESFGIYRNLYHLAEDLNKLGYLGNLNEFEQLEKIFNAHGFTNVASNLDELQEKGKTKITMMYDKTLDLKDPINKLKKFEAYIDSSTDFLVIKAI